MNRIDLQQIGTAKWLDPGSASADRTCETNPVSVVEAVRFVMQQLPPSIRGSAWIDTATGPLRIGNIQVLYSETFLCRNSGAVAEQLPAEQTPQGANVDVSTWDSEGGPQATC